MISEEINNHQTAMTDPSAPETKKAPAEALVEELCRKQGLTDLTGLSIHEQVFFLLRYEVKLPAEVRACYQPCVYENLRSWAPYDLGETAQETLEMMLRDLGRPLRLPQEAFVEYYRAIGLPEQLEVLREHEATQAFFASHADWTTWSIPKLYALAIAIENYSHETFGLNKKQCIWDLIEERQEDKD